VKPLELFFDLVFVLAITQCTALMVEHPTWEGVAQGLIVLALLWWSWTGFAWLTSVVDPEEGAVRIALFATMAGLLLVALTVPDAFAETGLEFALAYGVVRAGHIALFLLASRDDPGLRQSVAGLGFGTAIGVGMLIGGSFLEPGPQLAVWGVALALDLAEPFIFGSEGWKLVPGHFAERHWLIVIVALGESIVALGVGAEVGFDFGVALTAVLGIALVCELWWLYFDVVAIVGAQRLVRAPEGRVRNELARDVYSYMHYLIVAGIVLGAVGLHEALAHFDEPLHTVPAFTLLGGVAVYLGGHIVIRWRHVHSLNRQRALAGALLLAFIPLATEIDSVVTVGIVGAVLCLVIIYETISYGENRAKVRASFESHPA
jgi:low temperature requirement protein LtrA